MFRLRDGVVARVQDLSGHILLTEMDGTGVGLVERRHEAVLARIAQGMATAEDEASEVGQWLIAQGHAESGLDPDDPIALATLERIGSYQRWKLGDDFDEDLLRRVRAAHARRKIFYAVFGQTSCLPESALRRIQVIESHVAAGAHVVLIGDDDLLAVPLCVRGYQVTVCDIDTALLDLEASIAADFGVSPSLRQVNLLDPFPSDIVGTADVVFSDPISHDNCKSVFLGRACNAAKPGAKILSAVYADAREVLTRVAKNLPMNEVERHEHLTAYYYTGFISIDYQSDLVVFERNAGQAPVAADESMPDIDVTAEYLPYPMTRVLATQSGRLSTRSITTESLVKVLNDAGHQTDAREYYRQDNHRGFIADSDAAVLTMDIDDKGKILRAIAYPTETLADSKSEKKANLDELQLMVRPTNILLHDVYLRDAVSRRG